jgi:hypothetical protein
MDFIEFQFLDSLLSPAVKRQIQETGVAQHFKHLFFSGAICYDE